MSSIEVVIPEGVIKISDNSFAGCSSLKALQLSAEKHPVTAKI